MLAAGFLGPLLLLGSFAVRYGLGLDAPWYLAELAADRLRQAARIGDRGRLARRGGADVGADRRPLRALPERRASDRRAGRSGRRSAARCLQ